MYIYVEYTQEVCVHIRIIIAWFWSLATCIQTLAFSTHFEIISYEIANRHTSLHNR